MNRTIGRLTTVAAVAATIGIVGAGTASAEREARHIGGDAGVHTGVDADATINLTGQPIRISGNLLSLNLHTSPAVNLGGIHIGLNIGG
ncbi:hypothetical protein [Amycolatopsis cihanbeyliensis]|uniref:Small secreted domain DUF320 n=1 Tax=Amycolatopsis cihanbeyliensis TaxID=1128664 RepID=A0A542DMR8_AMYCI|nr:hypothetical protein [Amycolatopsis cihanbeyliensis]TQJ04391.1 hypothetical protein FB471_4181 [Amycolatopsis cihanbeyliensis]